MIQQRLTDAGLPLLIPKTPSKQSTFDKIIGKEPKFSGYAFAGEKEQTKDNRKKPCGSCDSGGERPAKIKAKYKQRTGKDW